MDLGRHHRRGRVGAHAAGVGSLVVIEDALMVLGRSQRQHMFAVGQDHERGFFTVEKFFDDDFVAGGAERLSHEDFLDGGLGFRQGRADQHAFAGGETVGFDDVG